MRISNDSSNKSWSSWIPATKNDITKINNKLNKIMATIDQIVQDIQDEAQLEDRVLVALANIQQQLKDALANVTLPPDVQAKIDTAFASLEANKSKLAAAVASP